MPHRDELHEKPLENSRPSDKTARRAEKPANPARPASGPPMTKPDRAYAETYRGKVPDPLIRLWLAHGWKDWSKNRLWLCDPALLQPLLDKVFDGDPDYDPQKMTAFAYDAFGTVHIWLGKNKVLRLNWEWNYATEREYTSWKQCFNLLVHDSHTIANIADRNLPMYPYREEIYKHDDLFGPGSEDLLPDAIQRLGALNYGEIYGFSPPLSMGGRRSAGNLQRVPILEHLLFLSRIQRPMLRENSRPIKGPDESLIFTRNGQFVTMQKSTFKADSGFQDTEVRPLGLQSQP